MRRRRRHGDDQGQTVNQLPTGGRVFNSGMKKKSAITDIGEISEISGFFIFIFYVYFLNLFFSETNIQKINFGR